MTLLVGVMYQTCSLRLDGSDDYVQTPVLVPTDSFTVEAIVTAENAGAGWSPIFGESLAAANTGIFFFGKRAGSGAMHYNIDGLGSADLWNVDVADGAPHHIALLFNEDRNNLVVFFDHQPIRAGSPSTNESTFPTFLCFLFGT